MRSFRERNPIPIGIVSMLVILLVTTAAYNAQSLPIIGGGTTYQAYFSEAAGLIPGDEVRVAGIRSGEVTGIELAGDRVLVTFRVEDEWVGDRTRASIQIETLLGAKYVGLEPRGDARLNPDEPIPLARTVAPFDVIEAFNGLSGTLEQIDTAQLARSFQTLADTFRGTPDEIRGTLEGLSRLSETIASRDQELARLLEQTRNVTGVLADRNAQFSRLIKDGNLLLQEVRHRRDAISALLRNVQRLSGELRGLVADNLAQLRPTLEKLDRVAATLQRNKDNLNRGIGLYAVFLRVFNNTIGTGRWFDNYICGLVPPPVGPANPEGC